MRSCDGIVFIRAMVTLSLITSCHKNCIVYGGSKLNGSDYDGCHEWQLSSHVVWNTHIDENRELNNAYQDDRQWDWLEQKHDDHENNSDWYCTYCLEIFICNVDQICCQRTFSDQHSTFIIFMKNRIQFFDLIIQFICSYLIFWVRQYKLVLIIL